MAKFLLVSTASWLLIACLTNIDGNAIPILFKFQQYFLACALFGLGLGFFQEGKAVPVAAVAPGAPEIPGAPDASQTSHASAAPDVPGAPGASSEKAAEATKEVILHNTKIGNSWAIWLSVVIIVLLFATNVNWPGGLPNALSASLQNESIDVYVSDFDKGWVYADITSAALFGLMLFAWAQTFVAPGKALKQFYPADFGAKALATFALGAVFGWALYAVLMLASLPPVVALTLSCLAFLSLSKHTKLCAGLSLFAITACLYMSSMTATGEAPVPDAQRNLVSSFWANGSKIDIKPLVREAKLLGLSVKSDHLLYQFLPAVDLNADDGKYIQKQYGLPDFSLDYNALPYMAMPSMKGKTALILGAGVGTEVEEGLRQGLSHITAVESQPWLTQVGDKVSFAPYSNKAVTQITDDPRTFLRRTQEKFDLIIYTGHSAVNRPNPFIAINHDDFLFTVESFFTAMGRLKDDGELVIVTPAGNDLVRMRLAANLIAMASIIEAELTTPYGNYLIASKSVAKAVPAIDIVDTLRQKAGAKIVNHQDRLLGLVLHVTPTFDDRPFMLGWVPMIPLADSFFAVMTMLAMACCLRAQVPQSILQNITRHKCRTFLLGVILMLLMCKACMNMALQFGTTPLVIYGSIGCGWLLLLAAGVICGKKFPLPLWLVRIAFAIALFADLVFSCGAAGLLAEPSVRLTASVLLPWSPHFLAGCLLARELAEAPRESLGLALIGFAVGCLVTLSAMFHGIASLDLLAASLSVSVVLLTFWPTKKTVAPMN